MKLGTVTKPGKGNKIMSKKFDDDAMPENVDINAIFSSYDHFGAIWKSDSGRILYITQIFNNSSLFILQKLQTELINI